VSFLEAMAEASRARVREARRAMNEAALLAACGETAPAARLQLGPFDLIAEIKRSSPAEGSLAEAADIPSRAREYAGAGAAAVSVLTEPSRFDGSLEDLRRAAAALEGSGVPAMRKDFLVDPWQVLEARACGAGGVLLILAMLEDAEVGEMVAVAGEHGMFVLLEAFDAPDLERAGALVGTAHAGEVLVGVNTRDLRTLAVDPGRLEALAPHMPEGVPAVAESGIRTPEDAARAAALGYTLALVGTALMRSDDPAGLARQMIESGRRAA
jgi:indole-3-glycerol phosphate synthase